MSELDRLYSQFIDAFNVRELLIPFSAVKLYKEGEEMPEAVLKTYTDEITLTSCQAVKQASLGDAVLLTIDNIGCVAAAITFGLVDQHQKTPLSGSRVYTDIMKGQSGLNENFVPPSPADFTNGTVYACRSAGRHDLCLFGSEDTGRFTDVTTAQFAVSEMAVIQPPTVKGVFCYSYDFREADIEPDVVVLNVRPVELTRIVQAWQFVTGKRVTASMGGLRAVNSDLIVRPYLTGEINISPYCLGARLIAAYDACSLGVGMPYSIFRLITTAMHDSEGGYPFHMYPGANEKRFP